MKVVCAFATAFLLVSVDGASAQSKDAVSVAPVPESAGAAKQGEVAYKKGDYATALRLWLSAANQDDADAQFDLGVVHVNGRGVLQDYVVAHMWFSLAAARGDTKAAEYRDMIAKYMSPAQLTDAEKRARDWELNRSQPRQIGDATRKVDSGSRVEVPSIASVPEAAGVVKQGEVAYQKGDYATAVRLWLPAANQGDANAQFDLGVVHVTGHGGLQDYVVAHMWFSLAAARGDTKAAEYRDRIAKQMSPAQLADAQKMARDFNRKRPRTSGRSTRN